MRVGLRPLFIERVSSGSQAGSKRVAVIKPEFRTRFYGLFSLKPCEIGLQTPSIGGGVIGHAAGAEFGVSAEIEARELKSEKLRDERIRKAKLAGIVSTGEVAACELFVARKSGPQIEDNRWRNDEGVIGAPVARDLCFRRRRLGSVVAPDRDRGREVWGLAVAPGNRMAAGKFQIHFAEQRRVFVAARIQHRVVVQVIDAVARDVRLRIECGEFGGDRVDSARSNDVSGKRIADIGSPGSETRGRRVVNEDLLTARIDEVREVAAQLSAIGKRPDVGAVGVFLLAFVRHHEEQPIAPVKQFGDDNRPICFYSPGVVLELGTGRPLFV